MTWISITSGKTVKARNEEWVCLYCKTPYLRTIKKSKGRPNAFCSNSCALKQRHADTPKVVKSMEDKREYWRVMQKKHRAGLSTEILPKEKKKGQPSFIRDNLKWARETYHFHTLIGYIPSEDTDEYGLYKYGEFLFNNPNL